ncbi:hypothetical protein NIES4071_53200 [Calothrix sp. NIES-4071]|nr:hypothetical protein NIES4071_53200 [Calothrix sp. NIES-4071]BAZ59628.1 hypothetical protein NIES4105_53150 [Calothrix sp. NIES-4105]
MKEESKNVIPNYPVRVWELLLILLGAFGLVGTALVGLASKTLTNVLTPARAEAIAQSLFDYQIPGGSKGVAGLNFGAKNIAIVTSQKNPPDVTLFVSKVPIVQTTEDTVNLDDTLQEIFQGDFIETKSTTENKLLCGKTVEVSIQSGQQIFDEKTPPVPAIRYLAKVTENGVERNVSIITNGENAQDKASKVFDSLRCRFEP